MRAVSHLETTFFFLLRLSSGMFEDAAFCACFFPMMSMETMIKTIHVASLHVLLLLQSSRSVADGCFESIFYYCIFSYFEDDTIIL